MIMTGMGYNVNICLYKCYVYKTFNYLN